MKTNSKLPITVIIPCADDIRIKKCLESVDEKVEIVVVLNGATNEVRKIVKQYNVKIVEIPERNLAKALNVGIENSRYPNVLFMDSDCVFQKGTIRKLANGLDGYYFSKGKVIFERKGLTSSVIAKVREYTTTDRPNAYKPPLAMKKTVRKMIGNYYFDSDIRWTEDADLNLRVLKANIEINFFPSAKIFHPPLTLKHDLRSAFRYGLGKRIRVEKKIAQGMGTHFTKVLDVVYKKGFLPGIYYLVWNCSYLSGYIYQQIFNPYKVKINPN